MNVNDKVFVVDWGKQYTSIYEWVENKRVCRFPIKTVLTEDELKRINKLNL